MARKLIPVLAIYLPGSDTPRVFKGRPLEITATKSDYRTFINGFPASPERLAAVITIDGIEESAPIVFEERLSEQNKRRFWNGRLASGWASKTGASCILKVTEFFDRERSGRFNLGLTCEVQSYSPPGTREQPTEAPGLLALFDDRAEPEDLTSLLEAVRR